MCVCVCVCKRIPFTLNENHFDVDGGDGGDSDGLSEKISIYISRTQRSESETTES